MLINNIVYYNKDNVSCEGSFKYNKGDYKMRFFKELLLFCIVFGLISCNSNITEYRKGDLTLIFDFSEALAIGKNPEVLEINLKQNEKTENYHFSEMDGEIILNDVLNGDYQINIAITFSDAEIYSAESDGILQADFANIVNVTISDAYVKLIIVIDTNPIENDDVNQFYNYSIDGRYFKQYNLVNAEELADEYLETPMLSFYEHSICSNLDGNMIPIVQYSFGEHYNPVTTCQTAMAFFADFIETSNSESYTGFINNADWLIDNMDGNGYLHYDFQWSHGGKQMCDNWISAMAQGEALGVMSMAYHQTSEEKYLNAANGFFMSLRHNKDGFWCVGIDSADYIWLEEYPSEDYCHVLNGTLFALWGLWDYYCITKDQQVLDMFEGVLKSMFDHYPNWNCIGEDSSLYCWHGIIQPYYHSVHQDQLIAYRDFFGIEEFNDMLISFIEH